MKKVNGVKQIVGEELKSKFMKLLSLRGEEYNQLYAEIESSLNETGKSILWNNNAMIIKQEIVKFAREGGQGMPTATTLALKTKLSRTTIVKHLKEMYSGEVEEERISQHKHLLDVILTNIGRRALAGDLKCTKLYVEMVVKLMERDALKSYFQNQQNNFYLNGSK